ncbi:hypothetical protein GCM10020331_099480 [Ectobacillus funiculus]
MRIFEVYDGALSASEVSKLKEEADKKIAAMDGLLLDRAANQLDYSLFINQNENKDEITSDLSFPKKGGNMEQPSLGNQKSRHHYK